jgi:ferredoxin-NADP reductase
MYQVLKAVLKDSEDPTLISLLYANQAEEDILLRQELDDLAAAHPDRFKVSRGSDQKRWRQGLQKSTLEGWHNQR